MWTSFVNLFLNLLLFIYKIVGNFGVAIIIFTVLIKLLTHPLMSSQIKSSKAMADMQKDPEYLEMMEKYKKQFLLPERFWRINGEITAVRFDPAREEAR